MLPIVVYRASHEPTPAQLKAGAYPKPLRRFAGLRVRVESKAGTVRRGTGPGGVPWETRMLFDYGYVVGSRGSDGDEVDVYLGPHEDAPEAYIVHQRKAGEWDEYDEDKVMLGFLSCEDAIEAYLQHYDDPRFLGDVTIMPMTLFVRKVMETKEQPGMIKAVMVNGTLLLLKSTTKKMITVPGYTKANGQFIPPHQKMVHYNPDHTHEMIAGGQGTYAQKLAHKKLSALPHWNTLSTDDQAAHVMSSGTNIQSKMTATAAISQWRKVALAGKNPTPQMWGAFVQLPEDKRNAMIQEVMGKVGTIANLKAPAALPSAAKPMPAAALEPAPAPAAPAPAAAAPADASPLEKVFPNKKAAMAWADAAGGTGYTVKPEGDHHDPKQPWRAVLDAPKPKAAPSPDWKADATPINTQGTPAKEAPKADPAGDAIAAAGKAKADAIAAGVAAAEKAGFNITKHPKGMLLADHKSGFPKTYANITQALKAVEKLAAHGVKAASIGTYPALVAIVGLIPKPDDGPKEGDTKQGADGTLVLHDGHWVKQGADPQAQKPSALPEGWAEASPGGLMTSGDPVHGGIIDSQIKDGKWFVIPNDPTIGVLSGFDTRAQAHQALLDAVKAKKDTTAKPAEPAPSPTPTPSVEEQQAGKTLEEIEASGAHYRKMALKKLKATPEWGAMLNVERLAKVDALYKQLQHTATMNAAFSEWNKAALAGKNPTPLQWKGFNAQGPEKQAAAKKAVTDKLGVDHHLQPPGGYAPAPAPTPTPAPAPTPTPGSAAAPKKSAEVMAKMATYSQYDGIPIALAAQYAEAMGATITIKPDAKYSFDYSLTNAAGLKVTGKFDALGATKALVLSVFGDATATSAPAQAPAAPDKKQRMNGETKAAADGGVLVFWNGHWHKLEMEVLKNTQDSHDKFWSVGVIGHQMITHHGPNTKFGKGGSVTVKQYASSAAALTAASKLKWGKVGKGYKYHSTTDGMTAGEIVSQSAPSVSSAPAQPTPAPKPAPAKPAKKQTLAEKVDAITPPDFANLAELASVPNKKAAYINIVQEIAASVKANGKAGFTKYVKTHHGGQAFSVHDVPGGMKVNKVSATSSAERFKMLHAWLTQVKAACEGSSGNKKAAPTPAPAVALVTKTAADTAMDATGWQQTGPQGGFNEGGVFKDPAGAEWYLKFPSGGEDVVRNEVLANKLYALAGCKVPEVQLVKKDGKVGVASRMLPVKKDKDALLAGTASGLLGGFAADAWLANWDTVGNNPAAGKGFDNIQFDAQGNAYRIDAGGSVSYGGAGGAKKFGDTVEELKTLRDAKKNAHTAQVFGKMTDEQITASVAQVAAIDENKIREAVMVHGPGDLQARMKLLQTLLARRADMVKQYPGAKTATPTKPFKINAAELSTPPDFMSWGDTNKPGPATALEKNVANAEGVKKLLEVAIASNGDEATIKAMQFPLFDKDASGAYVQTGTTTAENHPSKWIKGYSQQLLNEIEAQRNPPPTFKWDRGHPLAVLDQMHPAVKMAGKWIGEKIGKFLALGKPGTLALADLQLPPKLAWNQNLNNHTFAKQAQAAIAKMPATQRQAVKAYTGSKYHEMNGSLWTGNPTGAAKAAAEALHTLGHEITPGTILSRKITVQGKDMTDLLAATGKVLQEPAIMSTSIRPSSWSGNVHLKMHVGPGVKGLYVGHGSLPGGGALSSNAGEDELVLPPNTRLLILGVHSGKDLGDGFPDSGIKHVVECVILPTSEGQ